MYNHHKNRTPKDFLTNCLSISLVMAREVKVTGCGNVIKTLAIQASIDLIFLNALKIQLEMIFRKFQANN